VTYDKTAIQDREIPQTAEPLLQHVLTTYASETNKVHSVWSSFAETDLGFKPHVRSSSVGEILKHQLLSERRFFAEFLDSAEVAPGDVLPRDGTPYAFADRLVELARARLPYLAAKDVPWWLGEANFFGVNRQRIWIFWRRVLHTAHHRTQLTVYQRLMDKTVLPTYGPTADVTWKGADPTLTVEAAGRKR
jgi:uncharacterized damage-inducible protein DinB